MGQIAARVHWLIADITEVELEPGAYDVWHDRAVFHFLTASQQRAAYVRQVARAVRPGGHVIVSTFGPEGPTKCSGLTVVRYNADSLHDEFGARFRLVESLKEMHETPFGTTQQFLYCYCRVEKRSSSGAMALYAKYVLPRLIDLTMRNKDTTRLRAEWIPLARGDVLEIGIGSGLNLAFYSSDVQRVYGVDPSAELQRMARKRADGHLAKVEFISQSAEEPLPIPDNSIDTVVVTWTLCSIPDPPKALQQMKRILKPGGCLIFVEHGRAPDSGVARSQDRLNPVWKRIGGGCHLNRKIDALLTQAGFQIDELRTTYLPAGRAR